MSKGSGLLIDHSILHERVQLRLRQRHLAEKRFKVYGIFSIGLAVVFIAVLFATIVNTGSSAFKQTKILLQVDLGGDQFGDTIPPKEKDIEAANFHLLTKRAIYKAFPTVTSRGGKRQLYRLLSSGAPFQLKDIVKQSPDVVGKTITVWVTASDDVDMVIKGKVPRDGGPDLRRLTDQQMGWLRELEKAGAITTKFNTALFLSGDSREPELAGIGGALVGSFLSILVCIALALPIGVMSAVYLEEFAPKNRYTDLIEVNINNLAAVPSIVFGLLGLAIFLNMFDLPRSAPLVGGMVLSLMTLPTIIIASRASIKAVPPSIREAATALGASWVQVALHHVVPLARPGIMSGTVIGVAQALGETAPLLMIGMVAFVVDIPGGILDAATALPVQVFLWSDIPERAFSERTAAAILILLAFTMLMNLTAVILRRKFETSW